MIDWIALAGVVVVAISLVLSWRRYNVYLKERDKKVAEDRAKVVEDRASRDEGISKDLRFIKEKLNDKDTGLTAINTSLHSMRVHCSNVSTALAGRVTAIENDVKENRQEINKLRNGGHYATR